MSETTQLSLDGRVQAEGGGIGEAKGAKGGEEGDGRRVEAETKSGKRDDPIAAPTSSDTRHTAFIPNA